MSKNVAVFVDVANIFYAAKAAGVDIDYVTLLKSASAGRDLVRAYAYTGLDPENENQRNFHAFLARHGYRVVSKDIRKYGDGKVKANLDIELVVDMMKTARNLDIAIVVSGDGDFAPAIRAVQEMGVRVEVISFRGNTSSDLIDVADQFTDITQLAKVEKGSSRSGRRVAGDEADLSMTEVPDKQTEGAGGRSRSGRGRGRGRAAEPAVEVAASRDRDRSARPIVALPGEKLSRAPGAPEAAEEPAEAEPIAARFDEAEEGEDGGPRRRRRRGGRGRGRGRGRLEGELVVGDDRNGSASLEEDLVEEPAVAPAPRSTPFGSVWDSQLGTTRPATPSTTPFDEEDLDEPEIPEYLIAEQRRDRSAGRGRGGARGGRGSYASAIERERYGRGGSGGINRYPDVGGREHDRGRGRSGGSFGRGERAPVRSSGGSEPWSEVPPELEAALRAQLAAKPRGAGRGEDEQRRAEPSGRPSVDSASAPIAPTDESAPAEAAPTRRGRGGARRAVAEAPAEVATPEAIEAPEAPVGAAGAQAETAEPAAPKRRTTRSRTTEASEAGTADAAAAAEGQVAAPAPTRRRTARKTAAADAAESASGEGASGEAAEAPADGGEAAPKRRTRRTTAASAEPTAEGAAEPEAAPRRRTTRRTAAADGESS